jgi:hypothetical protein
VGFISKVRNMKVEFGGSSLQPDAAVLAERNRQEYPTRALFGPAGVAVYGPAPDPEPEGPPPPPPVSPDRVVQAAHEVEQRRAARAPYLAPARGLVHFTRVASRAERGIADVCEHLAGSGLAGRPDLVYGVYQLPDHIGRSATRQGKRYVEWDIVHAPHGPLPPAPIPGSVYIDARQQWVARASGEPMILDEDLAAAVLHWAQAGAETVLGVARQLASVAGGGGQNRGPMYAKIAPTGMYLLWTGPADLPGMVAKTAANSPIPLPTGPPPGYHVESLNWRAIAKAVWPITGRPYPVPSPFPHLPSTPQELLTSYLEVVGVDPADCFSAQVTVDREMDIAFREGSGWATSTRNVGESQPCVDGKDRGRLVGATHVVVAYRDRPEYVEGRARWAAYEWEVMQARLNNRNGARRPVPPMDMGSLGKGTRTALKAAGAVASFVAMSPDGTEKFDHIPEARYCWPPADIR